MTPLDFFDGAQAYHFQVRFAFLKLALKEEDGAHCRLLDFIHIHLSVEDELIVGHTDITLAVAERCKDLTRALYDNLARWRLTLQELFLEVHDVEVLQVFLLNN